MPFYDLEEGEIPDHLQPDENVEWCYVVWTHTPERTAIWGVHRTRDDAEAHAELVADGGSPCSIRKRRLWEKGTVTE